MNETETRKTTEKINEIKSCFCFFKINKINKFQLGLPRKKRGLKQNQKQETLQLIPQNAQDRKRLLRTITHQQTGQLRRNRHSSGNIKLTKTES